MFGFRDRLPRAIELALSAPQRALCICSLSADPNDCMRRPRARRSRTRRRRSAGRRVGGDRDDGSGHGGGRAPGPQRCVGVRR